MTNFPEPTTENQLAAARKLLQEQGWAEVHRHGSVSVNNRHRCNPEKGAICFCCACAILCNEHGKSIYYLSRGKGGH